MKKSQKKVLVFIIIMLISIALLLLNRIIHWTDLIFNLLKKFDIRILIICAILLSIAIILDIWKQQHQYEDKNEKRHKKVKLNIIILGILGAICISIVAGIATSELYRILKLTESGAENNDPSEEYVPENNSAEVQNFSEVEYSNIDGSILDQDDFSRPTYSLQEISEGALGDKITFNSIKITEDDKIWYEKENGEDFPIRTLRNETNFVGAHVDNGFSTSNNNVWESTEIEAEDGKTYVICIYVHNNSLYDMDSVAENTQVRFYVPYGSSDSVQVNGWLKADNAEPGEYHDDVTFKSKDGNPFHLEYVYDSALLKNGGFAKGDGVKMPNTVVSQDDSDIPKEDNWTLIGYDGFDGKISGCYEYINYVTIRVKVIYDYDFTIQTQVRLADDIDKTWKESVEAKVGDKVEFQITYTNTSNQRQDNVQVRDLLPSNLRYVEESTQLLNDLFPEILYITDGDPSDILHGINIGNYEAGANAHIMFTAEVVDDNLAQGKNTLVNWGQSGVGEKTLQDIASVSVSKE